MSALATGGSLIQRANVKGSAEPFCADRTTYMKLSPSLAYAHPLGVNHV
jgi:hypothetical protein